MLMKKIYLSFIFISSFSFANAQQVELLKTFNTVMKRANILNLSQGSDTDSILVKSGSWIGRVANFNPGYTISSATVGLSKATLNSLYPNVPIRHMVFCPSIILGGAIYIKVTENGTNDTWQTISAPPTI